MWDSLGSQMMQIHLQELLHPAAAERLARQEDVLQNRHPHNQRHRQLYGLGRLLAGLRRRQPRVGLPPGVAIKGG